jgi:hypothetical protein
VLINGFLFQARGASVGDIFIASDCAFHDRRIPIPVSVVSHSCDCCIIPVSSSWFFLFLSFLYMKNQGYEKDLNELNNILLSIF